MQRKRTYSTYAEQAVLLLGKQIKFSRKQRGWSEQNLAERAGISRATLQKIESGEMTPSIGLAFEAAALVGVNLFEQDVVALPTRLRNMEDKISLLPKRIRSKSDEVDDDF